MTAAPAASAEDQSGAVIDVLRGVLGPADGFVPLHEPEFRGREAAYVTDCIETGWVSSVGGYVDRIERDLATITGVGHAVATANGTSALHIALMLAGVTAGDEVLVPALTFVATANAVAYLAARPHFVDSEDRSLGIDADALETYLQGAARLEGGICINRQTGAPIRALVVLHVFGHPCDLDALSALAARWNLVLVEDAAEALGSRYRGRHVGGHGRLSALSFNGNKIVTTGGGGAVLTHDPDLARRAKHLTTQAKVPHPWAFSHDAVGYNYRMPNLNAALGCAQLERLDDMLERKRALAARYQAAFAGFPGLRFLAEPDGTRSNYWLNALIIEDPQARDGLLTALNAAGLMARPVWTLMHRLPMFADSPRAPLPIAERLEATLVNIPSSARLADQ
ncbi:LegC family aminotransferase [Rhizobium sp. CRIBSB]|nr:LegC family aminotransferase [Rhizobium sp. CRIBSB]